MESLKYQVEREILRDNLINYDKQIKTKREEIASFTSSFVALYSTPVESSGDPVKEVLDSMLFYIELKESFVSAETL